MANRKSEVALALAAATALLMLLTAVPGVSGDAANVGMCIRNCAQCKKMFGPYFDGQTCADSCIKFKGKIIPDCVDFASISPFLNKLE